MVIVGLALAGCSTREVLPVQTMLLPPSASFGLMPAGPTLQPEFDPSAGWIKGGLDRQRVALPVHWG